MKFQNLQTRFLLAGCLLVITTVAGGVWSVIMFAPERRGRRDDAGEPRDDRPGGESLRYVGARGTTRCCRL